MQKHSTQLHLHSNGIPVPLNGQEARNLPRGFARGWWHGCWRGLAVAVAGFAVSLPAAPVRWDVAGEGPNIAVDAAGRWHLIYFSNGTYRYRVYDPARKELSGERDTGLEVQRGSLVRGYGHIAVDPRGVAHIFTGMGYAGYLPGANRPETTAYMTRDPALAMAANGTVLLVMRGKDLSAPYSGDGTVHAAFVAAGDIKPGPIFNLDAGLKGRGSHIYPCAAAGPDGSFHVIYRQGPEDLVWYLRTVDRKSWTGGPVPVTKWEGPQVTVSSTGRVIAAGADGETVEWSAGKWRPLGSPVGGAQRSPPALGADGAGNVYATHNGFFSVLRSGTDAWTAKVALPGFVKRREHDQGVRFASLGKSGVVVVYEGADVIYGFQIES